MISRLPAARAALACAVAVAAVPGRAQLHDIRSAREAYGPVTICFPQHVLAVGPEQGVVVWEEGAARQVQAMVFDPRLGHVSIAPERGYDDRKFKRSSLTLPGLGTVERYDYPEQDREHAGIPGEGAVMGRDTAHREYLLPALGPGGPLRIMGEKELTSADVAPILVRFSRRTPETRCDSRLSEVSEGRAEVQTWSPTWIEGPRELCSGALALPLRAGERARRSWPILGWTSWELVGAGYSFKPPAPLQEDRRRGETGNLVKLGYTFILDETGSGELVPPPSKASRLERMAFQYKGADSATLEQLIGRLELVKPGDRRCREQEKDG